MLDRLRSIIRTPTVEFLCYKEDEGVIPPPYPARKYLPDWYKNLAPHLGEGRMNNASIKRCAPFLDALSIGWIIPLAADVEFVTDGDAGGVHYKWTFYREMVQNHQAAQVKGHPEEPKPPMKFLNWWLIRVPKHYSLLFMPPLNRPDPRFECISGLVDVDRYFEFINLPFFFKQPNYTGIVAQGTPLVQVVPIHRSMLTRTASAHAASARDIAALETTRRVRAAHESHYRDREWVRK